MIRLVAMPRSIASLVWRGQALDGDAQAPRGIARGASHRENGRRREAVGQMARGPGNGILQPGGRAVAVSAGRFLVAAFGDPGHAFPAIALARALAARGNEVTGRDLGALARGGRGRRARVHRGGGVQDVPPPPPGSDDGPSAADAALALLPMLERGAVRRGRLRHPHAGAVAGGRAGRAAAGDADPARVSGARAGAAVLRRRRAAAADAGRAGRCGGGRCRCWSAGWSAGATSTTSRGRWSGWRRPSGCTAGSPSSWRWWRRSRSSSIRGAGRRTCT